MEIKVSIVIVNYNGGKMIYDCVNSVMLNNFTDIEIVIVDNNSLDGSIDFIRESLIKHDQIINYVLLDYNYGPSYARNIGVNKAKGEIIAFLDNDTTVDKFWIENALKTFHKDKNTAAIQCKLLLMDNNERLDYTGEYLGTHGFLAQRSRYGEIDTGQYDSEEKILAAKSAGMFIRKKDFLEINGFDDDYFIFVEETDLCWRLWLRDHNVVFCPESIVYHKFSTTKSIVGENRSKYLVRFHGTKNYLLTLYKNLGWFNLLLIIPINFTVWFLLSVYFFIKRDYQSAFYILKALSWFIFNMKQNHAKRCDIQKNRIVSDSDIFVYIYKKNSIFNKIRQFFLGRRLY